MKKTDNENETSSGDDTNNKKGPQRLLQPHQQQLDGVSASFTHGNDSNKTITFELDETPDVSNLTYNDKSTALNDIVGGSTENVEDFQNLSQSIELSVSKQTTVVDIEPEQQSNANDDFFGDESDDDSISSESTSPSSTSDQNDENFYELGPLDGVNDVELGGSVLRRKGTHKESGKVSFVQSADGSRDGKEKSSSFRGRSNERSRRTFLEKELSTRKFGRARARVRNDLFADPRSHNQRSLYKWAKYCCLGKLYRRFILQEVELDERYNKNGTDELRNSMRGRFVVSSRNIEFEASHEFGTKAGFTQTCSYAQYRLEAVKPPSRRTGIWKLVNCASRSGMTIYDDANTSSTTSCFLGTNLNSIIVKYLHWTHRNSFAVVVLSAAVGFFVVSTFFALCLWHLGSQNPACIGFYKEVDYNQRHFIDYFELSWTTFATVGYGLIYAGLSGTERDVRKCTGITIILSLEAFIGMLYAAFCAAIFMAKVARIQSHAQVQFSDPILIRFGTGVSETGVVGLVGPDICDDNSEEFQEVPCPFIEFRIINLMSEIPGGELIDASVTIVASVEADQYSQLAAEAVRRRQRGKKGRKGGPRKPGSYLLRREAPSYTSDTTLDPTLVLDGKSGSDNPPLLNSFSDRFQRKQQLQTNDPTGHLVTKRVFAKLEVETPDHPFFRRVWTVRHRLDEFSPLLRPFARQMVIKRNGFWPYELNNYAGVRSAVMFDQILVSLSGTSNADASSVYAQHMYDYVDVNVGYRFVNVIFQDEVDGSLCVDHRLINDVIEQSGGGGEPLGTSFGSYNESYDMVIL